MYSLVQLHIVLNHKVKFQKYEKCEDNTFRVIPETVCNSVEKSYPLALYNTKHECFGKGPLNYQNWRNLHNRDIYTYFFVVLFLLRGTLLVAYRARQQLMSPLI